MDDFEEYGDLIIDEDANVEDGNYCNKGHRLGSREDEEHEENDRLLQEELTYYFDRIEALFNDALGRKTTQPPSQNSVLTDRTTQWKDVQDESCKSWHFSADETPCNFSLPTREVEEKDNDFLNDVLHEDHNTFDLYSDLFKDEIGGVIGEKNEPDAIEGPLKTISENCAFDLYSDILTDELTERKTNIDELAMECKTFEIENTSLKNRLQVATLQNVALKKNISALFKTAKLEIQRKDQEIHQLRARLDDLIFRRARFPRSFSDSVPSHNRSDFRKNMNISLECTKSTDVTLLYNAKNLEMSRVVETLNGRTNTLSAADTQTANETLKQLSGYHRKNSFLHPKNPVSLSSPKNNFIKEPDNSENCSEAVKKSNDLSSSKSPSPKLLEEKCVLFEDKTYIGTRRVITPRENKKLVAKAENHRMKTRICHSSSHRSKNSYGSQRVQKLRREFTRSKSRDPLHILKSKKDVNSKVSYSMSKKSHREDHTKCKKSDTTTSKTELPKPVVAKVTECSKVETNMVSSRNQSRSDTKEVTKTSTPKFTKFDGTSPKINSLQKTVEKSEQLDTESNKVIHQSHSEMKQISDPKSNKSCSEKDKARPRRALKDLGSHRNSKVGLPDTTPFEENKSKKCESKMSSGKKITVRSRMYCSERKPKECESDKNSTRQKYDRKDLNASSRKRSRDDVKENVYHCQKKIATSEQEGKHLPCKNAVSKSSKSVLVSKENTNVVIDDACNSELEDGEIKSDSEDDTIKLPLKKIRLSSNGSSSRSSKKIVRKDR